MVADLACRQVHKTPFRTMHFEKAVDFRLYLYARKVYELLRLGLLEGIANITRTAAGDPAVLGNVNQVRGGECDLLLQS